MDAFAHTEIRSFCSSKDIIQEWTQDTEQEEIFTAPIAKKKKEWKKEFISKALKKKNLV